MKRCRRAAFVVVGLLVLALAGCREGAQSTDAHAFVPADHLQKQQARIEQQRAKMKARPTAKVAVRRSIGA
jgi:hypothetical protein